MLSILSSNMMFNEIEYFTYLNIWLFSLFVYIMFYLVLVYTSMLFFSTISLNDSRMELISTLFSILFLLMIMPPALLILLEYDINILSSFVINSLGYQWAWTSNLNMMGYTSYIDHYIISSNLIKAFHYLFYISQYLLFSMWSSIKPLIITMDVIHSLGIYSFGIKMDAMPGRCNLAWTLRLFIKGEHSGFRYEPCGQGHSSMLLISLCLLLMLVILPVSILSDNDLYLMPYNLILIFCMMSKHKYFYLELIFYCYYL